jgi:hypothetical protein
VAGFVGGETEVQVKRTVEATLQAMGLAALITSAEASDGRSMKETERAIISFDSSDLSSA